MPWPFCICHINEAVQRNVITKFRAYNKHTGLIREDAIDALRRQYAEFKEFWLKVLYVNQRLFLIQNEGLATEIR